ncbi:hypothetical protein HU200_000377 [Digitaria exilis]|uniref:Uncharacterized protein n=1 Tax=Digitaria exilis TaxID=1010633 RepID=A0A835G2T8_9POAL|nr:hypothetical protein HU200_000377 [Digitaria exilis]
MAGRLQGAAASSSPLPRAFLLLAALALFTISFLSLRSLRPAAGPSLDTAAADSSVAAAVAKKDRSVLPDTALLVGLPLPRGVRGGTPRKLTGKYASEGYFFQNIRESRFRTDDPDQAHLFFVPISAHKMRGKVYHLPLSSAILLLVSTRIKPIIMLLVAGLIELKLNCSYHVQDLFVLTSPCWNYDTTAKVWTIGALPMYMNGQCEYIPEFCMWSALVVGLSRHSSYLVVLFGLAGIEGLPFMVKNSIRVVCSPSYNVDFIPHKDIALPQVLQPFALPEGGNDIENRSLVQVANTCGGIHLLFPMMPFHMVMYELWLRHNVIKY